MGLSWALLASAGVVSICALVAVPVALGAAIWMEDYLAPGWGQALLERNLAVLAGAPPLIYGLVGLELFTRGLDLDVGPVSAGLCLALLILPQLIARVREAIARVSSSQRAAGLALGGTRGRIIWQVVLPAAGQEIVAGVLAALARAVGSTAVLLLLVSLAGASGAGAGEVLPLRLFEGLADPLASDSVLAGAALALVLVCLGLEGGSSFLRGPRARAHEGEERGP